eukprot:607150-Rhodomonas_salina.1
MISCPELLGPTRSPRGFYLRPDRRRHGQSVSQTDRQTVRQTDRQTNRGIETDGQAAIATSHTAKQRQTGPAQTQTNTAQKWGEISVAVSQSAGGREKEHTQTRHGAVQTDPRHP